MDLKRDALKQKPRLIELGLFCFYFNASRWAVGIVPFFFWRKWLIVDGLRLSVKVFCLTRHFLGF